MGFFKDLVISTLALMSLATLSLAAPINHDIVARRTVPPGSYPLRCTGLRLNTDDMVEAREHFYNGGDASEKYHAGPGGNRLLRKDKVHITGRAKDDPDKDARASGIRIGYGIDQILQKFGEKGGSVSVNYKAETDQDFIVHVGDKWV